MQAPSPTIPGSPKAALELLHRARQDLQELSSPETQQEAPSPKMYGGVHTALQRGGLGGRGGLKGLAASLRKSLSVDIGEHED